MLLLFLYSPESSLIWHALRSRGTHTLPWMFHPMNGKLGFQWDPHNTIHDTVTLVFFGGNCFLLNVLDVMVSLLWSDFQKENMVGQSASVLMLNGRHSPVFSLSLMWLQMSVSLWCLQYSGSPPLETNVWEVPSAGQFGSPLCLRYYLKHYKHWLDFPMEVVVSALI